jgi:NAD(P)-dependent dehydrogenase (short-subunit alcohol dehydrogenase family)
MNSEMMLTNKVAVVYGGGGQIGGAIARAFANEGAKVFVTGRRLAPIEAVVDEILSSGGSAEGVVVDATDEEAIGDHLESVVGKAGRIDISFNAIGMPFTAIVGVPLGQMDSERFLLPIKTYTLSYFLTARLAAIHMIPNGSGIIMTLSALPARSGTPLNGGYGPAQAAKEAMTRDFSYELAPQGIRVVCLRPHGIPETDTMKDVFDLKLKASGMTWDKFQGYLASTTHPKRVMNLAEVASMAVFMASDRASGMTGTTVNMTMGSLDD